MSYPYFIIIPYNELSVNRKAGIGSRILYFYLNCHRILSLLRSIRRGTLIISENVYFVSVRNYSFENLRLWFSFMIKTGNINLHRKNSCFSLTCSSLPTANHKIKNTSTAVSLVFFSFQISNKKFQWYELKRRGSLLRNFIRKQIIDVRWRFWGSYNSVDYFI